ncbi:MAG: TetR family transcriptional regulator [Aquabacterium sp.]|uniref:TetR family transcriptional regulator n=1 Tax=Aquabacterium sp. TaxID=1872578 RepID=UPI0012132D28|nr:TetR family transcriptional regulator [Aquabacterium sp.]TAK85768.1 MAG: TetR family transcriptional regulator [Aquabacterium sp.]
MSELENSPPSSRKRDRTQTENDLKIAMDKIVATGKTVSISAVAREAGVTPALIHNKYQDVAEAIRRHSGHSLRDQRNAAREQLASSQHKNKLLREEIRQLDSEVRKLASINEMLRRKLAEAQAIAAAENVIQLPTRPS